jgi:hypothetical protein
MDLKLQISPIIFCTLEYPEICQKREPENISPTIIKPGARIFPGNIFMWIFLQLLLQNYIYLFLKYLFHCIIQ